MATLSFDLHAVGVLAPGLGSLAELREIRRGEKAHDRTATLVLPSPSVLPAHERRRASQAVRLALACIEQALTHSAIPGDSLRSVFATDEGTGEVCQQMLETLATTRQVSPLLFPNSVQNAPSGYFSIAWHNRQPATVVSLGLESFAAGLLCAVTDACSTEQPVLLVSYDPIVTPPLDEMLAVKQATATAWIISSGRAATCPVLGSFTVKMELAAGAAPLQHPPWLPPEWAAHSSARALAALGLLDAGSDASCHFSLGHQLLSLRKTAAHA